MKKIIAIATLCLYFTSVSAQETQTRKNDIMISPIELIAGSSLNVSYERLLNNDSGVGINVLTLLENTDSGLQSQISPYYRMYFGAKYASGFFVEGFAPITTSKSNNYEETIYTSNGYYYVNYNQKNETKTTLGLGIGFGGKWVARRNIIFEASAGIARRFGDANIDKVTGKGMLGIGFRF